MSKHPKSRHRIPPQALIPRSDPISEHYQAEVDRATHRAERRYRENQAALAQAEWDLTDATGARARRLTKKVTELRAEALSLAVMLSPDTECANHRMRSWRPGGAQ